MVVVADPASRLAPWTVEGLMPKPDYELGLKRLEHCARLVEEIATGRERLRTVLQQARLILDRTGSKLPAPPAAHLEMAPRVRAGLSWVPLNRKPEETSYGRDGYVIGSEPSAHRE